VAQLSPELALALFEHYPDAVLVFDTASGDRHACNAEAERTLHPLPDNIHDWLRTFGLTDAAVESKPPEITLADGRVAFVRLLRLDAAHSMVMLRDVSTIKRLTTNQNEFIHLVSHDLRAPLTSVHGYASMLAAGVAGDLHGPQRDFVTKILRGVEQISAQVDNIQDAGRYDPETGFYELVRVPVDLLDLIHQIVRAYLIPAEKQNLHIEIQADEMLPIIRADANMLRRAISNLYDNAVKYTPNGGRIVIQAQQQGSEIRITIRDTGPGIPEDLVPALFNRHVRLHRQEHRRIKGSGLGLFIVRSVAQRHGGRAWVESREGEGSAFHLALPLASDAVNP
jgi:signal transduction histidine kinase